MPLALGWFYPYWSTVGTVTEALVSHQTNTYLWGKEALWSILL